MNRQFENYRGERNEIDLVLEINKKNKNIFISDVTVFF